MTESNDQLLFDLAENQPPTPVKAQPKRMFAAGLLMYRVKAKQLEVFLVHPGGPYYSKRDNGCWTIPKGEIEIDEDVFLCARREFKEETGIEPPSKRYIAIGNIRERSGKVVYAWAFRKNYDTKLGIKSNEFHMEWPPGSGTEQAFPEVDEGKYFSIEQAKLKMHPSQLYFLDRLQEELGKING